MPRIIVIPERLQDLSQQCRQQADALQSMVGQLNGTLNKLDWEARQAANVSGNWQQANGQGAALAEQAQAMSRYLARKAQAFAEADSGLAQEIGLAAALHGEWQQALAQSTLLSQNAVKREAEASLRLGNLIAPVAASSAMLATSVLATTNNSRVTNPGASFFGGPNVEYRTVKGQLFIKGSGDTSDIDPDDVSQGMVGDCYFMASLAAIARTQPDLIRRMIRDNGDGTYTVTFYQRPILGAVGDLEPVEVTVNSEMPIYLSKFKDPRPDHPAYAQFGDHDTTSRSEETWPVIIEKAYAKMKGGYGSIRGGEGWRAMEELTGKNSDRYQPSSVDMSKLAQLSKDGAAITVGTLYDKGLKDLNGNVIIDIPDAITNNPLYHTEVNPLVAQHEYYVTSVDETAKMVTVRNPWGWNHGEISMSFEDFRRSFAAVSVNDYN